MGLVFIKNSIEQHWQFHFYVSQVSNHYYSSTGCTTKKVKEKNIHWRLQHKLNYAHSIKSFMKKQRKP